MSENDHVFALASGNTLLEFAISQGSYLDEESLPADLRKLHWCAAVCLFAVDWLSGFRGEFNKKLRLAILIDLQEGLAQGEPLLRRWRRELALAGGEPIGVNDSSYNSATEAGFAQARTCLSMAQCLAVAAEAATVAEWCSVMYEEASVQQIAEEWPAARAAFAIGDDGLVLNSWIRAEIARELWAAEDGEESIEAQRASGPEQNRMAILTVAAKSDSALKGTALLKKAGLPPRSGTAKGYLADLRKRGLLHNDGEGFVITAQGRRIVEDKSEV